jgi:DNA polymerase I-like protein with 3'-5' exonuclease and polymerase domains
MVSISASYGYIKSVQELEALVDRVVAEATDPMQPRAFAFDIETGYFGEPRSGASVHPEENFVVGISFTNSTEWARYVPLAHDFGPNIEPTAAAPILWKLLSTGMGVPHNASFELRCMARFFEENLPDDMLAGILIERASIEGSPGATRTSLGDWLPYFPVFSDTMIEGYAKAAHRSYGLKPMVLEVFGHQMAEIDSLFPDLPKNQLKRLRFNTLELTDAVVAYACEDSLWTLALHLKYYPQVKDNFIYKMEMGVLRECMAQIEDTGVVYDWRFMRDAAARGNVFLGKLNADIQKQLSAMVGTAVNVNLGSPAQLREILYDRLGMKTRRVTKGSQHGDGPKVMSTDALALKGLAARYPVVHRILEWKKLRRLVTVYLEKYEKDYCYAPDGRTHPSTMQTAVLTGRFAVSGPPYQQSPKKYHLALTTGETFSLNFRDAIVAPADHYILGFDVSQGELRVIAGEAQEPALLEAYANGEDIHRKTAGLMLGTPMDAVTDEQRQFGKTLNFALMYRMTADSLAERLNCTVPEARDLYRQYFDVYSSIEVWADRMVQYGKQNGFTVSRFGRRHPIWEFQSSQHWTYQKGERLCVNAPIQGGLADYVKLAMVRIQKALRQAGLLDRVHMCMNIHDALNFYVHRSVSPAQAIAVIQPAALFSVKGWPDMALDWYVGLRWGSVHELTIAGDGSVNVKGVRALEVESATEEEGEATGPSVDLSAVRVAPAPAAPVEVGPQPLEEQATVEAIGMGRVLASTPLTLSGGVETTVGEHQRVIEESLAAPSSRTVLVELDHMPSGEQFGRFMQLVNQAQRPGRSGGNTVILRTPQGEVTVSEGSSLDTDQSAEVSIALGGARVVLAPESVDAAVVTAGLRL